MKSKQFNDLRLKTIKSLKDMVDEKKANLLKIEVSVRGGKQKNLKEAKNLRHEIAQILTVLREKEIEERELGEKPRKNQSI